MQHGVAIRTYGPQINHRVELIALPDVGELFKVMNVNVSLTKLPIRYSEIEPAYNAGVTVGAQTSFPSMGITFVGVNRYRPRSALDKHLRGRYFFRQFGILLLCGRGRKPPSNLHRHRFRMPNGSRFAGECESVFVVL